MSILDVSGLTVRSGAGALVRDVSFSLAPGERLGLIGESGSGKSLTSLAVTGLLPDALSASGSVLLDDHQVIGARDADLRPLRGPVAQIVFQEPLTALDPLMRVGRQVAEPLRRHLGLRGVELKSAVATALDEVSCPTPASRGPTRMSSRVVSVSAWRSPSPSRPARSCSSPTSRRPRST